MATETTLVLGTMTFGWASSSKSVTDVRRARSLSLCGLRSLQLLRLHHSLTRSHAVSPARARTQEDAIEQLDYFAKEGFNEIDTARMYANGDTEDMLGRVLQGRDGISVTGARAS